MNQGLFESLTGHFLDNTPVDAVPAQRRRIMSIMDHLSRMFNTRQGSIAHMGEYGLPDVSEIYRKMPDGIDELREAIRLAITKYEPRLTNARVVQSDTKEDRFRLTFIVSGELTGGGGMVRFQTSFTSMGQSSISQWKRPD